MREGGPLKFPCHEARVVLGPPDIQPAIADLDRGEQALMEHPYHWPDGGTLEQRAEVRALKRRRRVLLNADGIVLHCSHVVA